MNKSKHDQRPNRRTALKSTVLGGVAAITVSDAAGKENSLEQETIKSDKECIIEAGLTEAEADCWEKTAEAAAAFFKLPKLHPEDAREVSAAIHIIQNKLLGRPTYRRYLEIAKANQEAKRKR